MIIFVGIDIINNIKRVRVLDVLAMCYCFSIEWFINFVFHTTYNVHDKIVTYLINLD